MPKQNQESGLALEATRRPAAKQDSVQLKQLRAMSYADQVQRLSPGSAAQGEAVQQAARAGTSGGAGALPHLGAIQRAFGRHDVSAVGAHVGGKAAQACSDVGAEAYATGDQVAFAEQPTLRTAAHEAAHIVQQRAGVKLEGGVGKSGDTYERQADAVADAVVQGKSAEGLLGNAPTQGAGTGPVQMFREQKTRVTANEKKGEHGFVTHDVTPTIGDDPRAGIGYKTQKSDSAEVLQSDDGTLAINGSSKQAQEFYAQAGLTEGWNQELAGKHTAVRLAEQGTTIDTSDGKLVQVKPTLDGNLIETMSVHECFDVANIVLGKDKTDRNFEAVFQEEGKEEEQTSNVRSDDKNKVASYLTDHNAPTDNVDQELGNKTRDYAGKEYGKQIGKGKLSDRVKKLGVNEHAKADIGEAFVTYSARAGAASEKKGKTDYTGRKKRKGANLIRKVSNKLFSKWGTKSAPKVHAKSWEMHYAGIVAKSGDGKDRVSLEDYNRTDEVDDMKVELVKRLRERYDKELSTMPENATVTEILTQLEMKLGGLEWMDARNLANKAVSAAGKGSWFMKMYGSKRGQTFHDQSIASGDFVNPLTMRVRAPKKGEQVEN